MIKTPISILYSNAKELFLNVFLLLSRNSYIRNGHNTLRITSWNLDKFTFEKSTNPGVKEVICRTILENKWSVICLQEIIEPSALHNICKELNQPSLRRVIEWKDNTNNWKYITNATSVENNGLNGLGFIYNADRCDLENDECFEISLAHCEDVQNVSLIFVNQRN